MNMQEWPSQKWAALVSILTTAYFAMAAIMAHLLAPDYDFVKDYISDYAIGPWGWIYGSAFLASCAGCFALSFALVRQVPAVALSRVGVALLVLVGLTYAVDFAFPTDILPPGAPPETVTGTIHLAAALLGWVLFVISAFMLSSKLKIDPFWLPWHRTLTGLAWLALSLLVVLAGVVAAKIPFGGLAEKAFILDRNVWALVMAFLAFHSPGKQGSKTCQPQH